jgi:hypothetical protein
MNVRPLVLASAALAALLGGCTSGGYASPTTGVEHPLDPQPRLDDHAQRLADGIARWREVRGQRLPGSVRDLALTIALDGEPCFTEILKDHWEHPYAYSPIDDASGRFQLASAGPNGQFGDGDDLRTERFPGDPRVRTYGFTWHVGE